MMELAQSTVVQVIFDYEYTTREGSKVSIKPPEHYELVAKSSDHWWYVRKDAASRPFYIPAQYVTEMPPEQDLPQPPSEWNGPDPPKASSDSLPVTEVIRKEPKLLRRYDAEDALFIPPEIHGSAIFSMEMKAGPGKGNRGVTPLDDIQGVPINSSLQIEDESPYAISPPHFPTVSPCASAKKPNRTAPIANPQTNLPNDVQMLIRAGGDSNIWEHKECNIYESIGTEKGPGVQDTKDKEKNKDTESAPASVVPPPVTIMPSPPPRSPGTLTQKNKENKEDELSAVYVNLPRARQSLSKFPSTSPWGDPDPADLQDTFRLSSEGWEMHTDEESGKEYYFHPSTGRSTWEYPLSPSMESEVGVKELSLSPSPLQSPACSPPNGSRLSSDWERVLDESSGRPYFFNPVSGESCWDPPEDLLTPSSSGSYQWDGGPPPLPEEDYPAEEGFSTSPGQIQAKPSLFTEYSLAHVQKTLIPRACLDQSAPAGWTLNIDPEGVWVFTSQHTQEQWIKSLDDRGQTYYYLRDGSKSQWNLPELSVSPKQCQVGNGGTVEQDGFRMRIWRNSTGSQEEKVPFDHGRLPSDSDTSIYSEMQHNVSNLAKAGILNKTRISENGKKVRKNWAQSWSVLHGGILTFHKDPKSSQTGAASKTNQIVPEYVVELKGATVGWAPKEKSSKKNVLELKSRTGTEFLIQYDTESIISDWHKVITDTIRRLDIEQNHSDDDEEASEKSSFMEKEDRSVDKRRLSFGNSNVGKQGSSEADQKKVRNKLRKFLIKRPTLQSVKEKGYIRENVFGCHLSNLCNQEGSNVPSFVRKCIQTVERRGLGVDGIYRVSGNLAVIQKLRFKADHENLDLDEGNWDIHVITGALKLFFRELQEPLFPYSHFNSFVQGIKLPDYNSRISYIRDLVRSLPPPNHDTMEALFSHLRRVIEHGEENRMTVQNVAIVFGPTLLKPEVEAGSLTAYMVYQNQIIEFILSEYETIFHM